VDQATETQVDGVVMIENYDSVDVFVGVDVGKGEHHAFALNKMGKVVFDKALGCVRRERRPRRRALP